VEVHSFEIQQAIVDRSATTGSKYLRALAAHKNSADCTSTKHNHDFDDLQDQPRYLLEVTEPDHWIETDGQTPHALSELNQMWRG